ncbi:MAG: hypothetical protein M3Y56_09790, partial [Armatimonadota bacterium]|nr:hypothetical protein [Armatimonadota bacterium]
ALGYLKDMGVPGNVAQDYHKAVENGGAILSVHLPSGSLDTASAQELLNKYGAANISLGGARA